MRVISGKAKSLRLKTPNGQDTRPTTDRIKETLFNMLGASVYDSVFLDLFAGSGAIGIEALSRGARHSYFVENGKDACSCISENLKFTHLSECATLIRQDVLASFSMIQETAVDYIFMDPPYALEIEAAVLEKLSQFPWVNEDTTIIIEALIDRDFSFVTELGYKIKKEKCYKTNKHVFLGRRSEE